MIGCIRVRNKGDNEGDSKTTGFEKECGINDDGDDGGTEHAKNAGHQVNRRA